MCECVHLVEGGWRRGCGRRVVSLDVRVYSTEAEVCAVELEGEGVDQPEF